MKIFNNKSIPITALLFSFISLRIIFQQLSILKTLFIYPTGYIVEMFYGFGHFSGSEWIFGIDETKFILGESCSGTTFFSLLASYIVFRVFTHKTSFLWLALAYPIAIVANTMRVLSSIYAHEILFLLNGNEFNEIVHVITGSVTFLLSFLLVAFIIEKPKGLEHNAA